MPPCGIGNGAMWKVYTSGVLRRTQSCWECANLHGMLKAWRCGTGSMRWRGYGVADLETLPLGLETVFEELISCS